MTHLLEGVELCTAVVEAAKRSFEETQTGDSPASTRLRASRLLLIGAIALEAFAIWPARGRSNRSVFSHGAEATAVLLAGLAVWNSREILRSVIAKTTPTVNLTLERQWLRSHPITYA